jgi:hypothetical protein
MKLIVAGLLIAVGPVLAAGLGALIVKVYGQSGFADLLQWTLLLLVVSIPLGAALVVAGAAAKIARRRAQREAGITDPAGVRLRDWLPHVLLGIVFMLLPFLATLDIGDRTLTPEEAWRFGFTPFYVASGVALVVLALFVHRGAAWARWPVALWCPVTMFGGVFWGLAHGVGRVDLYDVGIGIFICIAWMWIHLRKI